MLADFHVHLEASLRLASVFSVLSVQSRVDCLTPIECNFAACFCDCVEELAKVGCTSAEVRYSPASWKRRGIDIDRQAVLLRRVRLWYAQHHLFDLRYVATIKRDGSEQDWGNTLDLIALASGEVVAIDVSRSYKLGTSPNGEGPPLNGLRTTCDRAAVLGVRIYVHCGWFDSHRDVWVAIDELGAMRIGHGLAMGNDKTLWSRLSLDRVVIEVCPTAARRLAGIPLHAHPLPRWAAAGIGFVVGSDHPRELQTTIADEYRAVNGQWPELRDSGGWRDMQPLCY